MIPILLILAGLVALTGGGELLVRGASGLANSLKISPLVIGLTVVAFGTSAPELAVSLNASLNGQPDISMGNVVGSNIFNVLFILGISALIVPLAVSSQLIRFDVPVMIAASITMYLMCMDGNIGRVDGIFLAAGIVVYTVWLIWQSRREQAAVVAQYEAEFGEKSAPAKNRLVVNCVLVIAGLVLLAFGSGWLVDGASTIARTIGISELVIGLTIVAAGTSLPEVAASVMASIRGERDIAVGNVVGSNVFNICSVLGISAIVAPSGINVAAEAMQSDIPVMLAVAIACLPVFFTGSLIARWEGAVFLGYYVAYVTFLVLNSSGHPATGWFANIILWMVVPLTVLTLGIAVWRSVLERKTPAAG